MKLSLSKGAVVLASAAIVVAAVTVAGCSSNKGSSDAPATSSQPAPAAPSGEAEHGEATETVAPAATVAGIWTQIDDEQTKLTTAIQNGQLKDVHHLAFG